MLQGCNDDETNCSGGFMNKNVYYNELLSKDDNLATTDDSNDGSPSTSLREDRIREKFWSERFNFA